MFYSTLKDLVKSDALAYHIVSGVSGCPENLNAVVCVRDVGNTWAVIETRWRLEFF